MVTESGYYTHINIYQVYVYQVYDMYARRSTARSAGIACDRTCRPLSTYVVLSKSASAAATAACAGTTAAAAAAVVAA